MIPESTECAPCPVTLCFQLLVLVLSLVLIEAHVANPVENGSRLKLPFLSVFDSGDVGREKII